MTLLRRLSGCRRGGCHCKWGSFDFEQPFEYWKYLFFMRVEGWQDLPRRVRWRVANKLSSWAARLRGDESIDIGYGTRGNRAAALAEALVFKFVPTPPNMDDEEAADAIKSIHALERLARADFWQDYE